MSKNQKDREPAEISAHLPDGRHENPDKSRTDANRVALIATTQSIDTSHDNPTGRLQMHVLMAVAEFERSLIRERTKAGLNSARARGAKLGRRPIKLTPEQRQGLASWRETPTTLRELAMQLGVSVGKAHGIVKAA